MYFYGNEDYCIPNNTILILLYINQVNNTIVNVYKAYFFVQGDLVMWKN